MIFRHLLNMRSHPTWVRGLKHVIRPLAIALLGSHPTWVRGLKLANFCLIRFLKRSHPTWVRGLKRFSPSIVGSYAVAPYVGAWIETHC